MKKSALCLVVCLCFGLNVPPSNAQEVAVPLPYPDFHIDYAGFAAADGNSYVEMYTRISFSNLQFTRSEDVFQAMYSIEAEFENGERIVAARTFLDTVSTRDFNQTKLAGNYRVTTQGFFLPPGRYQYTVTLTDLETKTSQVHRQLVTVRSFAGRDLHVSDLQLARRIEMSEGEATNQFVKNGRFVEPHVARTINYFASKIQLYYEVYGLDTDNGEELADVRYTVTTRDGKPIKSIRQRVAKPCSSSVHTVRFPIHDLESGAYNLVVEVTDGNDERVARSEKPITIGWVRSTHLKPERNPFVQQLKFIAEENEILEICSVEGRHIRASILEFWKRKDPTPETEENELMDEYYSRVNYANSSFLHLEGAGWKSDQGQVYIQFGPPDVITRTLRGDRQAAEEVWEYNGQSRRFVFVDRLGLGFFELKDPVTIALREFD